ncbi:hypothetical protein GSI_11496 [Ganoderma sinense ZZ0214-1]|uniref:Uncharacterized protein n=1 Tax=Ganoderma sinense ZZ0214-1 TaxID=1077348 RepID=A0A2G8RW50_9APHY|nr:hypothetical protein GSI_11496 [Ganoderma sinense ZZ0214-1]
MYGENNDTREPGRATPCHWSPLLVVHALTEYYITCISTINILTCRVHLRRGSKVVGFPKTSGSDVNRKWKMNSGHGEDVLHEIPKYLFQARLVPPRLRWTKDGIHIQVVQGMQRRRYDIGAYVGIYLHPWDAKGTKARAVASEGHKAIEITVLHRTVLNTRASVMIKAECLEVRPRLRHLTEVGRGIGYNWARELERQVAQSRQGEERFDELCERGAWVRSGTVIAVVKQLGFPMKARERRESSSDQ